MRVVTLGSLGAIAPVVPAGAPQYYGMGSLGEMTTMETLTSKPYWAGVGAGLLVGGLFGYWLGSGK